MDLSATPDTCAVQLSRLQREMIVGSLLGDGAMRCKRNALFEVNHGAAQRTYVDWKYRIVSDLVRTPPKLRMTNGGRVAYRFTTLSTPCLTALYDAFYQASKKQIPPEIDLAPLTLAVWFMDDGCRSRSAVYLNTQQFTYLDQARLRDALWRTGIATTLNQDKTYSRIRVRTASIQRLSTLIGPHILPEMRYKLPPS